MCLLTGSVNQCWTRMESGQVALRRSVQWRLLLFLPCCSGKKSGLHVSRNIHDPLYVRTFVMLKQVSLQCGLSNFDLCRMSLMKNGVYQVTAYGTRGEYEHGSNSVFLELRRGQRVHLQLQDGTIYEHPGGEAYTTFTGFMLYEN